MNKDIVLIEWVDSKGMTNWEDIDGLKSMPPCVCYTVGFLLEDNENYKTVALALSEEQLLGRLTIPTACIQSMKRLTRLTGEINGKLSHIILEEE